MRRALLRNLSFCTKNLHYNLKSANSFIFNHRIDYISENVPVCNPSFPSIRSFCSKNEGPESISKTESVSSKFPAEGNIEVTANAEDVTNKELKLQVEDYLNNFNEGALPSILESVLRRKLSGKHEDTDDEFMDTLEQKPIDDVTDGEFEADFEEALETDEEIDDLYSAREIAIKKMTTLSDGEEDPYFHMDERKWDDMIKEAIDHGDREDTKECEEILEDMLKWDELLPDEIKKKVEEKFDEIGDRVEKGEIEVEEGYALFKEFEDQMVEECAKIEEGDKKPRDKNDLPGEGPILRWRTRVVISPGGDAWHPKNRKVKLGVTVKEFGLSKYQFLRLKELAGKRYNPGKDELTITSERFEHREENRKDCLRTLFALMDEAGKARGLVEAARTLDIKQRLKVNANFMQRLQSTTSTLLPA